MDYSNLKIQISKDIVNDKQLQKIVVELRSKFKNKTAKYSDVVEFSKHLGNVTSKCLQRYGIPEAEFEAYAKEIVVPTFRNMQKASIEASEMVQQLFNDTNGIGIKPAHVVTDESRLLNIEKRFKEASKADDVSFLIGNNVAENIARSAVTDSLRANAKLLNDVGYETYVTRSGSGCCEWCDSMLGTHPINDVPTDFWRVHRDCTCSFDYKAKGIHSRITFSTGDDGKITKNTTEL